MIKRALFGLVLAFLLASRPFDAAAPIQYRFTFPEPEHHWMQVEASFSDLSPDPLELRMSRSSPGRYSLHDFAKNVYDVHAFGADGRELTLARPDPYGWWARDHGSIVTVRYKVYGDRVDGTYLAVDTTHAHINMPASVMWARGLEDRPATLTFEAPAHARWQVATQLHEGQGDRSPHDARRPVPDRKPSSGETNAAEATFTAPNLQYLMDSPVEFGPIAVRQFSVGGHTIRFALHHTGTDAELDSFVKDVEKIVRQEGAIYGEFPEYEPGSYTFVADYLPYASGDGMEHRNSTVLTASGSIQTSREQLLDTVAHEFFHGWNVERIRPRGLEPFDFDRANSSGELWLAEGFTQYFGPVVLRRAGLVDLASTAQTLTGLIEAVSTSPARLIRSAEEMSRMAPFIDGSRPIDRTNWSNTVISYYPFGGAIALALDLALRDRSDSRITLDDYMRAMWRTYGKPGGGREGYVDRPYTIADAEAMLGEVSGDRAFAREFFSRYIQGHDLADYRHLLSRAGLVLRKRNPGHAWWGDVRLEARDGAVHVAALVPAGSPAYASGLDQDDSIRQMNGERIASPDDVAAIVRRHKPGDRVQVVFVDRSGQQKSTAVTLGEDPHVEIVPVESIGGTLTAAERGFREHWLGPRSESGCCQP